ncbi:MAG: hypothetical protein IMW90_18125 [Thermogemmatispora sp.]|uniref:hypothetical protein n=1 Tax=Thermogemmatispora sp. TaxID=1968838 RepID=UPI001A06981D|nr:hypothetical protein [Thermogemmatispora sp.]MBE3567637.1 hypothetical protein [Thermogemmatispora sp.]
MLYSLGDLRAQGLLQQRRWWHLGLSILAGLICLVTLYRSAAIAEAHPFAAAATLPLVLTVCAFLLLVVNALSVGTLSETSGQEEIRALCSLPVTVADIARIRLVIGLIRSELVALIFFLPVCVATIVHLGWTPWSILASLTMVVSFPLLPAVLGVALNLRETRPRLVVWLSALTSSLAVGLFLSQQVPVMPGPLAQLGAVLSLPVRGVLAQAAPSETLLFAGVWTLLAAGAGRIVLRQVSLNRERQARERRSLALSLLRTWLSSGRLTTGRWGTLLTLSGLALARLSALLLAMCTLALALWLSISLHLLPAHTIGGPRLSALITALSLLLQSVVALVVCLGPLLTALLGEAREHRVQQPYPIAAHWHTAAVYLTFLGLAIPLVVTLALLAGLLSHNVLLCWFSAYLLSALPGGGAFLLATVLGRRPWIRLLVWGMGWLLVLLARVVVLAVGVTLLRVANPLLLGLLSGVLVDILLCLLCWRGLIVRQYRRFLEEDL